MTSERYRVAVIPGDGIGQEVVPEGMRVLEAAARRYGFAFRWDSFPWSCETYHATGRMMPVDGLDQIAGHDAIFLGAVGFPGVPDHISLWGLLIPIRRRFDQYINVRPVRVLDGMQPPLRDRGPADIDFIVVRENVEGEYSEVGGRLYAGTDDEMAMQESIFTRRGVDRVLDWAFELAATRPRPARDLRDQVERDRAYDAVLGRAVRGCDAALSGHRDGAVPHRHSHGPFRAASGLVRRGGRLQPVRRHPFGPGTCGGRDHRHCALGKSQPQPGSPVDVRAGARLGPRHRGGAASPTPSVRFGRAR